MHSLKNALNKILKIVKEAEGNIVTTSEIASKLKVSWNTAENKLLGLALENKILKIKKLGVNIWVLKR